MIGLLLEILLKNLDVLTKTLYVITEVIDLLLLTLEGFGIKYCDR